jgi:hypothetical protein
MGIEAKTVIYSERACLRISAARALLALAVVGTGVACSSAPSEVASHSSSALVPQEDDFAPTRYTFTIDHIVATDIEEPPADVTYDTGYIERGELAVKTISANALVLGNTTSASCILGPASTGTTFTTCAAGYPQNNLVTPNGKLSEQVVVTNANDQVFVAFALDNVEGNAQSTADSALVSSIGDGTSAVSSTIAIAAAASTAWTGIGAFIGLIGASIQVAGDDLSAQGSLPTGGELYSCAGGLVAAPPWTNPTCNASSCPSATAWEVTGSQFSLGKIGLDTIYFEPTLRSPGSVSQAYFTPQDLENLTATGTATLEVDVAESDPNVWVEAGVHHPCSSSHKIFLTVARDWTTGTGPSPKSGDGATARTPSENDEFLPNPLLTTLDRNYVGSNGWMVSAASLAFGLSATTPIASISRDLDHLDTFWANAEGDLDSASWVDFGTGQARMLITGGGTPTLAPNGNVSAATPTPVSEDVFFVATNGAVYQEPYTPTGWGAPIQVTPTGEAPAGGGIAATARTITNLDVFYFDVNGALEQSSSSNGGNTWSPPSAQSPAGTAPPGAHLSATSAVTSALEVFFIGNDGALHLASWSSRGWSNVAISAAGIAAPGQSVSAVSRIYQNLDVVFLGNQGTLYWSSSQDTQSQWAQGGTWSAATALPHATYAGFNVSLVARTSENLDVYFQDAFGNPWTGDWSSYNNTWTVSEIPTTPFSTYFNVTPATINVEQNDQTTLTVTATGSWMTASSLGLSFGGLPAGVTASVGALTTTSSGSVTGTITLSANPYATAGAFQMEVIGTSYGTSLDSMVQGTVVECVPSWGCFSGGECGTLVDECGRTETCGSNGGACPTGSGDTCESNLCCPKGTSYNIETGTCTPAGVHVPICGGGKVCE